MVPAWPPLPESMPQDGTVLETDHSEPRGQ